MGLNTGHCQGLYKAIGAHKTDISETIEIARKLRTKTASHLFTDDELSDAKNEGRP